MKHKVVPSPALAKPAARSGQGSAARAAAIGPDAVSALRAARGGGRSTEDLLALQRAAGNRAVLQLMPARGRGHDTPPTPGDGRSYAEMKADVSAAIAEAQTHVDHPESTVASVEQALPEIRDRHGLRSLALTPRGGGRHAVVGKLNPGGQGEDSFLGAFAGFGMDSESSEEEAPREGMSEELAKHKAREREAALKQKADKARRAELAAARKQEEDERRRKEAAKEVQTHYVYPSEMTGDIWHAAAALTLNPKATVHFVSPRDVQTHEYEQHLHDLNTEAEAGPLAEAMAPHKEKLRKADVGITQLRTAVKNASKRNKPRLREELANARRRRERLAQQMEADPAVATIREQMRSRVRNAAHVPKDRAKWVKHRASNEKALADFGLGDRHEHLMVDGSYRTANVAAKGVTALGASLHDDDDTRHVVLNQKKTTTAVMEAMGPNAVHKDRVINKLRTGLAGGADAGERAWVEAEIKKIRARVAALRKSSKKQDAKLLMINRREGHENMQHNTSDAQFADLTRWYGETHLAGKSAAVHAQATMGVATGAQPQAGDLDLYDQAIAPALRPQGTKRRTALLWARIADLQKEGLVHGLIGGRSGSMDIAAFMGVNAYSWDEHKPDNVDYQRLKETEPIMTVGHMQGDDHKLDEGHVKGWMKPPPSERRLALQKRLSNLDQSIAQIRATIRRAPKKQKAALRQQLAATAANRKKVAAALLGTP